VNVEQRIIDLYAAGKSREEIADILCASGKMLCEYQVRLFLRRAAESRGLSRAEFEKQLRQRNS